MVKKKSNTLEQELQEELKETKRRHSFLRNHLEVKGMTMNNFFCHFPGGPKRIDAENYRGLDNNTIVGYFLEIQSDLVNGRKLAGNPTAEEETNRWKKHNSDKFNSVTYREFYENIDTSLRDAGVSEEVMKQLYEMHERHRKLRGGDGFDYDECLTLLGKDRTERIMTQYTAYVILRKMGYSKDDLTA